MQPGKGAFDDPARTSEPTAVRRSALGQFGVDPAAMQVVTMGLRIVAPIALNQSGFPHRSAGTPAEQRPRVDQRQPLRDVVPVRGGQYCDERNPVRVGKNVMFRPGDVPLAVESSTAAQ
jgi:hypothetical protein